MDILNQIAFEQWRTTFQRKQSRGIVGDRCKPSSVSWIIAAAKAITSDAYMLHPIHACVGRNSVAGSHVAFWQGVGLQVDGFSLFWKIFTVKWRQKVVCRTVR